MQNYGQIQNLRVRYTYTYTTYVRRVIDRADSTEFLQTPDKITGRRRSSRSRKYRHGLTRENLERSWQMYLICILKRVYGSWTFRGVSSKIRYIFLCLIPTFDFRSDNLRYSAFHDEGKKEETNKVSFFMKFQRRHLSLDFISRLNECFQNWRMFVEIGYSSLNV